MKFYSISGFLLFAFFAIVSCQSSENLKISFNDDWKFKLLSDSINSDDEFVTVGMDDSSWKSVRLPHTAHLEPLIVNNQWQGICWYRKSFEIPNSFEGKKVYIELEAAMNYSKVWINGNQVTEHQGGYLPVVFDISKYIVVGKENVIAIRLNNNDNSITGPKPLKILDFNMYGGLYRNAWMIVKNEIHISHPNLAGKVAGGGVFVSFPKVSEKESIVQVKTHIQNDEKHGESVSVVHTVFCGSNKIAEINTAPKTIDAGKDMEILEQLSIQDAKLWSPKSPNLYRLETSVWVDGKEVDKEISRFGIREFRFMGNDLFINGVKTFLRGVNRHQEYPFVGYALSDNAQYRDAKKIKEAGFDYIRLSHYPPSPAFLDACDELGIVVMDAILGWQYYKDSDLFRNYCYQSAQQLIRRDRNHACVLAWEVSLNETLMPIFFMEELHRITHEEYPGENVYSAGWMNDVYDIYVQARQHRITHFESIQPKPYSVSEYGDWEYYSSNAGLNQHNMPKQMRFETSSRQKREYGEARLLQQCKNIQEAHNDNFNTPAFSDSYWVMYDYNRGYHDDLESSGVMDIFRIPKFSYYFYKSQREVSEEIVLQIASYWTEKSPLDVKVFSNCDEVELYVNDQLVGRQNPDADVNSSNLLHPPFTFNINSFQEGAIKAFGYIKGKKVAEHLVRTPGRAVGLKLWLDESGRKPMAGCNDVLFLYIAAVDEQGTVVPDFSEEISLESDGSVEIMNVDPVQCEAGIATALIRIGAQSGKIEFRAASGNLGEEKFFLKVD